jgi:hypothetical protein
VCQLKCFSESANSESAKPYVFMLRHRPAYGGALAVDAFLKALKCPLQIIAYLARRVITWAAGSPDNYDCSRLNILN